MPNYDYTCAGCGRRVTIFQSYKDYGVVRPVCPECGSPELKRRLTRVRIAKGDDQRMQDMEDPLRYFSDADENDPKSLGRAMRRMGREMGDSDLPAEFDEITERLESGEAPESIEKDLPAADDA
jgi:putative FmdB family regulatory protein